MSVFVFPPRCPAEPLCALWPRVGRKQRRLHLFCFCALSLYLYHNCHTSLFQKDLWYFQFLCAYQDPYFQVVQIIANNKDCMDRRVTLLAWCRKHMLHLHWKYQTVWPPSPNILLFQDCLWRTSVSHSICSCHHDICAPVISPIKMGLGTPSWHRTKYNMGEWSKGLEQRRCPEFLGLDTCNELLQLYALCSHAARWSLGRTRVRLEVSFKVFQSIETGWYFMGSSCQGFVHSPFHASLIPAILSWGRDDHCVCWREEVDSAAY